MRRAAPLFLALAGAHVPTYTDNCKNNCCEPPHEPAVSQVVYLKNNGGLELHIEDLDVAGGQVIDFDVVFKEKYDMSTFEVYVGCGGCGSGPDEIDPLLTDPIAKPPVYQGGKLEPFTQTGYFPLLPEGGHRKFNTSQLATCADPDQHWSIRLVTYPNATETIVWGAVVGCDGFECEQFTLVELLSFPLYVFRNHGPVWNDLQWTIIPSLVLALLGMIIVAGYWWGGTLVLKAPLATLATMPRQQQDLQLLRSGYFTGGRSTWAKMDASNWKWSFRCFMYALATWALFADLIETLIHFSVAATAVGSTDGRGYGLFFGVVLLFGKLTPILLVTLIWAWHREIPELYWRMYRNECRCTWYRGLGFYSPLWAHGGWSLLELTAVGLVGFIWLGAGFWIFPSAVTLAALARLYNWCKPSVSYLIDRRYNGGGRVKPTLLATTEPADEPPAPPVPGTVAFVGGTGRMPMLRL